jgi:hypothetical protein
LDLLHDRCRGRVVLRTLDGSSGAALRGARIVFRLACLDLGVVNLHVGLTVLRAVERSAEPTAEGGKDDRERDVHDRHLRAPRPLDPRLLVAALLDALRRASPAKIVGHVHGARRGGACPIHLAWSIVKAARWPVVLHRFAFRRGADTCARNNAMSRRRSRMSLFVSRCKASH